jgi:hypothetical protein
MQAWPMLDAGQVGDVIAFFHWLERERSAIGARVPGVGSTQGLPWWEYR